MKKKLVFVLAATLIFSTAFASCSIGGGGTSAPSPTNHSAMSYSEKASYYDALVAGDNEPIPLTTALNSSVSIEGDSNLLEEEVYNKVVEVANQTFPSIRSRYASNSLTVTIILDASSTSYSPCYATGNTILLNTEWINSHPKECDILIEGFGSVVFNYSHADKIPGWLISAMKACLRDEFALYRSESSFKLPARYNGKSYEKSAESAAAFLKWIKESKQVDIMDRLNRQLRSADGYQTKVWQEATGRTLDQLWNEYKNA